MIDVVNEGLVLVRRDGDVALLTLNRPESRNALSLALMRETLRRLEGLAGDASLRALVVTGAGERAFCAGADLIERQTLSPEERTDHTRLIDTAANALEQFPVPVIAAIRGYALAGGAELAIACDLRVASTDAVLGYPEVKIGVFPGAGGAVRLPRIVGQAVARDLLYTGRRVNAAEAFRVGLVDRLTEPEAVLPAALALANEIAAGAPLAIRALKRALLESAGLPDQDAHRVVAQHRQPLDATADYQEGLNAFAERRPPHFTGR